MDELTDLRKERKKIMRETDALDTQIEAIKLELDVTDPNGRDLRGSR